MFKSLNEQAKFADLDEDCRKADLEEVFMKYGPLKEIWLASYAPYYAFVVYRDRMDAQVLVLAQMMILMEMMKMFRMLVGVQMV